MRRGGPAGPPRVVGVFAWRAVDRRLRRGRAGDRQRVGVTADAGLVAIRRQDPRVGRVPRRCRGTAPGRRTIPTRRVLVPVRRAFRCPCDVHSAVARPARVPDFSLQDPMLW
jgi:hypothetical protein